MPEIHAMTATTLAAACDATYVHGLLVGGAIGFVSAFALSAFVVLWFWLAPRGCAPDPDEEREDRRAGRDELPPDMPLTLSE